MGPDEPGYRLALDLGAGLARNGATVMCGGYSGVMEAVSRGAAEAGGHVIGVTVDLFERRGPVNPWVSEKIHAPDLFDRLRHLVAGADGHVVVEGSLGTLAELFLAWTLRSAGAGPTGPLVLLGPGWPAYLDAHRAMVPARHFRHVQVAHTPEEAVRRVLGAGPPAPASQEARS